MTDVSKAPSVYFEERIAGQEGFWLNSTFETYVNAYHALIKFGAKEEWAVWFLGELYSAAAEEYGG